jgi:hypothetical protein
VISPTLAPSNIYVRTTSGSPAMPESRRYFLAIPICCEYDGPASERSANASRAAAPLLMPKRTIAASQYR